MNIDRQLIIYFDRYYKYYNDKIDNITKIDVDSKKISISDHLCKYYKYVLNNLNDYKHLKFEIKADL